MITRRLVPGRRLGWVWAGITIGTVLNGMRLRARARALRSIGIDDADHSAPEQPPVEMILVAAGGVQVDGATLASAISFAARNGLQVLDLVPADLLLDEAYETVRVVDPATYRRRPLAPGRGPRQATLVQRSVAERAKITNTVPLDAVEYVATISQLKRYAARTTDLAVAPRLAAVADDLGMRRAYLSALYEKGAPVVAAVPAAQLALLLAGLAASPGWGATALATYLAQPYLVFAGSELTPPDLTPVGVLTRPVRQARAFIRTLTGAAREHVTAHVSLPASTTAQQQDETAKNLEYRQLLAGGIERFFEERRATCPLCGSPSLRERLRVRDLLQWKPGVFQLDECGDCGHVFQNPRLTIEGLAFYYKDFYDGMGGELLELLFSSDDASYRGRAEMVKAHTTPVRWLDVGAGHGHFCLIAADLLPGTSFEGLDLSEGVSEAERRGWIDRAYVGLFAEMAGELAAGFDVVSMHHYLEHTREPAEELAAAAKVLQTGGYLLIEVPDPEARLGRWFGPMWGPWFQPQHQHLLSMRNLSRLLGEHGFTVVADERGPAHQPNDLVLSLLLLVNHLAGPPARPWVPARNARERARRTAAFAAAAPFFVPALVADRLVAPLVSRLPYGSNTYRILARKG